VEPIRVLVVDDHEMVRTGLRVMLELEGIEVCGLAATAEEAIELAERAHPDVVLLDVRLGGPTTGLDIARTLRRTVPTARLVMLSALALDDDLFAALLLGAAGFLQKDISRAGLVAALRTVAAGGSLFDERLTESVLARLQTPPGESADPRLARLSSRERDILQLLVAGHSNGRIAGLLHLSEKTVKNNVTRIFAKLGVSRRTEAVAYVAPHDRAPVIRD
jgi:two-component system response regulator DevR